MKKLIAMLILVAVLAMSTAALANVKFTGSCYVYKHAGSGMTDVIIHRGSVLEDLQWYGSWVQVEMDDGTTGWVRTKYVTETSDSASTSAIYGSGGQGKSYETGSEVAVSGSRVKATGNVNIRTGASLSSRVLGTLHKGETLKFKGYSKKDSRGVAFYKVSYNGQTAWVSSAYSTILD